MSHIRKVAVLGSGVMGSKIAAHLANIGIQVLLLDIVPNKLTDVEEKQRLTFKDELVRNRLANNALKRLLKEKPAPFTSKSNIHLIETGNLEDDVKKLAHADWIIEAVVEKLSVKQHIFELVDQHRRLGSIISSNTSGVSVEAMVAGRSPDFREHFLGTHFFNPPRYMKLLELIPTKYTNKDVLSFMKKFGENVLGKGVIEAKDTPNFIANRIGTYGLLITIEEMIKGKFTVGEVDSITGTFIGRPKSATFRTLDVVGLDTFSYVAKNVYEKVEKEEKELFKIPFFMEDMIKRKWLGSKSSQGFYKKEGKEILQLNLESFSYEKVKRLNSSSIEAVKQQRQLTERLKTIVYSEDHASVFLWKIISSTLLYCARLLDEIAHDLVSVDKAMKWGFGWELGPFEIWDAIGVDKAIEKMEADGQEVPVWIREMLEKGYDSFYKKEGDGHLFYHNGKYEKLVTNYKEMNLNILKEKNRVIKKNSGASLIDIGDGVALLEFHSKSNAIGFDIIQMINFAVEEIEGNYKGLVIGNRGKNFSVGANLGMILMEALDDNLFEIDFIVRKFQQAMMKIKYSPKPIVAAPFGMTLGGGAEICLPAARIQASSETYIGLVETGVGLIPGGGGNKELYMKCLNSIPDGVEFDLQTVANKVFETVATAKVSTSATDAKDLYFLSEKDQISINNDHLLYDAKQLVLSLYESGYKPPVRKKVPVVGETGYAAMLLGAQSMRLSGYISDYDFRIAKKLAYVIAGGKISFGTEVDEQYLLDLEREAFLSLAAEAKTHARMQHMLTKGKPLRN
ncbi:3-hydroxyacyl-CoA dehydrogenase/enoyl-CoA hydratase family protein [Metabacillus fastidiosus]|uniref:3-hydroxyacyl-CoA dehydrogenase/enoyl-CoA hydratase family protein n=1 Tax=Metabacillus fastidiosus TaxID=1458 RepID=UPI002E24AE73|nr:3-hydroxyacyl-CoA dehydrogenase NAD-binding domain-containing protein [Metabacillus fastidiosus]MED4454254.1 3-hydroxyacyl-CoA dehydrogenase NAD-binding domain-containing protein [Metabacillus fastidiosus]